MTPAFSFSHMGMFVADLARMRDFYTRVLGFTVTDSGELETPRGKLEFVFMSRNPAEHHQIVLATGKPADLKFNPINQISFLVNSLTELREVHKRALDNGATEMRVVTHGNAWSCYFKDPEGNVVEAYVDTPFHVPQPHGVPFDLSKSDEEILRETEDHCRKDPGFMTMGDFKKSLAARLTN